MTQLISLDTPRLRLRPWTEKDYAPFASLNADIDVMAHFPETLDREKSDALADRINKLIHLNGWGFWAVEIRATGEFAGFTGLHDNQEIPAAPCLEVGWRLAKKHWGKGYAPEAAQASLAFGFNELGRDAIVAITTTCNQKSQRVMQKLGMVDTKENFLHPAVPAESGMQEHVLYRITAESFRQK